MDYTLEINLCATNFFLPGIGSSIFCCIETQFSKIKTNRYAQGSTDFITVFFFNFL